MPGYTPPSEAVLSWVTAARGKGSRVVSVHRLVGGLTSHVDRIVMENDTRGHHEVVLRRWAEASSRTTEMVERESDILVALRGGDIPVPHLIAADSLGSSTETPCLLMSALPGAVDLTSVSGSDWLVRLAAAQAGIHEMRPPKDVRELRWVDDDNDLAWIADEGLRREATSAVFDVGDDDMVFAHGDFQPFNVLWSRGELTGVVDWPGSGLGSRGSDVGHCRLNLAALFSAEVAEEYLARYEARAGVAVDPRSDLRALLRWSPKWLEFLPLQAAGRVDVDLSGMSHRVVDTIRHSLDRLA